MPASSIAYPRTGEASGETDGARARGDDGRRTVPGVAKPARGATTRAACSALSIIAPGELSDDPC